MKNFKYKEHDFGSHWFYVWQFKNDCEIEVYLGGQGDMLFSTGNSKKEALETLRDVLQLEYSFRCLRPPTPHTAYIADAIKNCRYLISKQK